jgi:L-rhamnonate dehydratase
MRVREFLQRAADRGWHHYPYLGNGATAAIEMALWDICGKAYGCPVHQFFGGLQTDNVPFYWFIGVDDRTADTARREAAEGAARGFKSVYIKIGFDLANDIALARAIRGEVGDAVAVRVDANEAWSVFEPVDALARFEDVGVEFVEQPIDMHNIAGLADLRRKARVRIGANQSAWLPTQVPEVIRQDAADVIVTDPHQLGGLVAFHNAATMCETAGIPVCKHAFADLGITTIATAHVLGTLPSPQLGHQQFLTFLVHDMVAEEIEFVDGAIPAPTGPGLGIELDYDALKFYEGIYEKYGEFEGYGPVTPESPLLTTIVSGISLADACRTAFRELKLWLEDEWDLDPEHAAIVMGMGAHCGIGQLSNLLHTGKCSIARSLLPPGNGARGAVARS